MAAAIAMSVGAYKTQLLFDKMKGQAAPTTTEGEAEVAHPAGAT